jgi:hypothetical protein
MSDVERVHRRMREAGVDLPSELVDLVIMNAGDMVAALDELAALDLGDAEPFDPALRLPADAAR